MYVASELTRTYSLPMGGSDTTTIAACVPLTVRRADSRARRWDLWAGSSVMTRLMIRLAGRWDDRILRTEKECETYYKTAGPPKVIRAGIVHTIPEE